jgi:hypothetical protein
VQSYVHIGFVDDLTWEWFYCIILFLSDHNHIPITVNLINREPSAGSNAACNPSVDRGNRVMMQSAINPRSRSLTANHEVDLRLRWRASVKHIWTEDKSDAFMRPIAFPLRDNGVLGGHELPSRIFCFILTPALTEAFASFQNSVKQATEHIIRFVITAQGRGYLFLKRTSA